MMGVKNLYLHIYKYLSHLYLESEILIFHIFGSQSHRQIGGNLESWQQWQQKHRYS